MKKSKKLALLLVEVTMIVTSLAGCGGDKSTNSAETAAETSQSSDGRKIIKVGISGTVETLNPIAIFTTGTWATLNA